MNGLEEGIIFYESHLPEEIIKECKEETNDKMGYVERLIEKYKENSNDIHDEFNIRTKNKDKSK